MYCLGRALDPNSEINHFKRVSNHLKNFCVELGLDKIKIHVSMKDIQSIEKKFNININVFGHNNHGDIHIISIK